MEPPHWQLKRCKVKEVEVGGRDVKAEVLRKRERECVMGNLGVAQGCILSLVQGVLLEIPSLPVPRPVSPRQGMTRSILPLGSDNHSSGRSYRHTARGQGDDDMNHC